MNSGKTHDVTITRLGLRGDGIAQSPEGPLYVAGALPAAVAPHETPPSSLYIKS